MYVLSIASDNKKDDEEVRAALKSLNIVFYDGNFFDAYFNSEREAESAVKSIKEKINFDLEYGDDYRVIELFKAEANERHPNFKIN